MAKNDKTAEVKKPAVVDPVVEPVVGEEEIAAAAKDLENKKATAADAAAIAKEANAIAQQADAEVKEAEEAAKNAELAISLDPSKFVAVDVGGTGGYSVHEMPEGMEKGSRTIQLAGKTYEHVGEHRGVWAYRHLG